MNYSSASETGDGERRGRRVSETETSSVVNEVKGEIVHVVIIEVDNGGGGKGLRRTPGGGEDGAEDVGEGCELVRHGWRMRCGDVRERGRSKGQRRL